MKKIYSNLHKLFKANTVKPKDTRLAKQAKLMFMLYFDGGYDIEPNTNITTYQLGVTKLEYIDKTNTLVVSLRRPGLLIGKAGKNIDELQEYLCCKISIIEVNLNK